MSADQDIQGGLMETRRQKRYSITAQGRYRKGTGVRFNIAIQNLSEQGCQFADLVGRVDVDDEITIRIGEIGPIPAKVKWIDRRNAGVEFDQALHPSVLDHVIAQGGKNEAVG